MPWLFFFAVAFFLILARIINSLRRCCFPLQCKRCKPYDIRRSLLLYIYCNNNCGTGNTISISVCKQYCRNIEISRQASDLISAMLFNIEIRADACQPSVKPSVKPWTSYQPHFSVRATQNSRLTTHDPSGTSRHRHRSAGPSDAPLTFIRKTFIRKPTNPSQWGLCFSVVDLRSKLGSYSRITGAVTVDVAWIWNELTTYHSASAMTADVAWIWHASTSVCIGTRTFRVPESP